MTKITQLDALTTQAAGDLIVIVDDVGGSPETKKITITSLFQGIPVDVSIGIAVGDGTLHVHTASAGSVTAHENADDLVIESNINAGISILTPADKIGAIYFGDLDNNVGTIQYDHTNVRMDFTVETVGVLRLTEIDVKFLVPLKILEGGAAKADTPGYGQLWVKDDGPNILRFTDDAGTDFIVDVTPV